MYTSTIPAHNICRAHIAIYNYNIKEYSLFTDIVALGLEVSSKTKIKVS